jgi:serine/threonine protein kinase
MHRLDDEPLPELTGLPLIMGGEAARRRDVLESVVSRFTEEVRRGLRPSIEQYASNHPELAGRIRELLPLVQTIEEWKLAKEVERVRTNLPESFTLEKLGNCRIIREVGRGGMGVVFEAVQIDLERRVAVKLLPWRFAAESPHGKERFQDEAATIANLRHRNIVPIYSFGEDDGYCYYVMRYIEGVSVAWVIRRLRESSAEITADEILNAGRGDLAGEPAGERDTRALGRGLTRRSWPAFAKIGAQVALALAHAHSERVLHNDIKPANLLLEPSGQVIVTDFGIGRALSSQVPSGHDHGAGTLKYMAPERFAGRADERSDVYSLGATLYELLTQTPPFQGDSADVLIDSVLHGPLQPPRVLQPRLPRRLEEIVLKALARDPDERHPSAKALAGDLLNFINRGA